MPQPTAPGDLVGLVLENTLTHPVPPRYVTFGTVLARGQLPQGQGLAAAIGNKTEPAQIDVKNRYKDGSVKFGIVTLQAPTIGNGADTPVMLRTATPGTGTGTGTVAILPALRKHDITIMLALQKPGMPTSYLTIDAAKWFATAQPSLWLAGPLVSEARISRTIQGSLRVVMDIRTYASGGVAADIQLNNDIAMGKSGGAATYGITISQDGKPVFAVPSIHQFQYQDWHTIIRSGGRAPINIVHDVAAMERIGAVPAYELSIGMPRANLIAKLKAISSPRWDAPMAPNGVTQYMPMTGGRGSIGPTTAANATWLITQNPIAAEYAMGQADAAGAVPWHFFDLRTGEFVTTADIPNIWTDGRGGPASSSTGLTQKVSGKTGWTGDVAHEPDLSFIPYLMTGRRYYLDQQNAEADFSEVGQWPDAIARNNGEGIIIGPAQQVRGAAWGLREIADAAYIDPDGSPMCAYFKHMVANNMAYLKRNLPIWTAKEGQPYGYVVGTYGSDAYTTIAPWQQDYFAPTMATMVRQGVPGARKILRWETHFIAGSLFDHGDGYNRHDGITYNMFIVNPRTKQPTKTWAQLGEALQVGGQSNGSGWAHSDGDYALTRLSALASIYNATGSREAISAYQWLQHSGAPFVNINGYRTTVQFWIVPLEHQRAR